MEINITHMMRDHDSMIYLSGSCAEHGEYAGRLTWNNSIAYAKKKPLLKRDDDRAEARDYFAEFGAWSKDEIAAWSEEELQAIVVQHVASEIREMERYRHKNTGFLNHRAYRKASEEGTISGSLYFSRGKWFFTLSH